MYRSNKRTAAMLRKKQRLAVTSPSHAWHSARDCNFQYCNVFWDPFRAKIQPYYFDFAPYEMDSSVKNAAYFWYFSDAQNEIFPTIAQSGYDYASSFSESLQLSESSEYTKKVNDFIFKCRQPAPLLPKKRHNDAPKRYLKKSIGKTKITRNMDTRPTIVQHKDEEKEINVSLHRFSSATSSVQEDINNILAGNFSEITERKIDELKSFVASTEAALNSEMHALHRADHEVKDALAKLLQALKYRDELGLKASPSLYELSEIGFALKLQAQNLEGNVRNYDAGTDLE